MRDDIELLEAWRAGDRDGGSELFERHFEAVCNFFRTKVGSGVEDLIQRTFVAAIESKHDVRGSSGFRPWLLGVARHVLFRHFREQDRDGRTFEPLDTSVCDLDPSPSAALARDDRHAKLLAALRTIPVDLQIALELYFWEDMTMREIAEVIGVPQGTAASRLRRGKEALLQALQRAGVAPPSEGDDELAQWARRVRDG